jgi:hypothetical protein
MKENILALDISARNLKLYTETGVQRVIPHNVWGISKKYLIATVKSISEEYQINFDSIAVSCAGTVKDNQLKFYWGQPLLIGLNSKHFKSLGVQKVCIFNDAESAFWDSDMPKHELLTITVGSYIGAYPLEQESFKGFLILSLINGLLSSQLCPKKRTDKRLRKAAKLLAKVCKMLMKITDAKFLFLAGGGTLNEHISFYLMNESLQFEISENPRFSSCRGAIRALKNLS